MRNVMMTAAFGAAMLTGAAGSEAQADHHNGFGEGGIHFLEHHARLRILVARAVENQPGDAIGFLIPDVLVIHVDGPPRGIS